MENKASAPMMAASVIESEGFCGFSKSKAAQSTEF
jgi:hypothetical protein